MGFELDRLRIDFAEDTIRFDSRLEMHWVPLDDLMVRGRHPGNLEGQ